MKIVSVKDKLHTRIQIEPISVAWTRALYDLQQQMANNLVTSERTSGPF